MINSILGMFREDKRSSPVSCWAAYGVLRWVLDQPRSEIAVRYFDLSLEIECAGYRLTFDLDGDDLHCLSVVSAPEGEVWLLAPSGEVWAKPGFLADENGSWPMVDPMDADLLTDSDWSKLHQICFGPDLGLPAIRFNEPGSTSQN